MTTDIKKESENWPAMPEYIRARLKELEGKKTLQQIAHESGYVKVKMISMFASGEVRVPLDRTLLMAKALQAPLLAFFRLAMGQYGPHMAELADAISERLDDQIDMTLLYEIGRVQSAEQPRSTAPTDAMSETSAQALAPEPEMVALHVDVPRDFHRRFHVEAAIRGLSNREMLMLMHEFYLCYRDQPGWAIKKYFPGLGEGEPSAISVNEV